MVSAEKNFHSRILIVMQLEYFEWRVLGNHLVKQAVSKLSLCVRKVIGIENR